MDTLFGLLAALSGPAELPPKLSGLLGLLGRTHVIMIHFPVALLLMAALGEVWTRMRRRVRALAVPAGWTTATLLCGALGAVASMGLGWLLVWFNGYEASPTLRLHQIFGTATAIVAVVAAWVHWKIGREGPRGWSTVLILLSAALVGVTGHLGGTLTHGSLFGP